MLFCNKKKNMRYSSRMILFRRMNTNATLEVYQYWNSSNLRTNILVLVLSSLTKTAQNLAMALCTK
jgi:hypothetical protein